MKIAYFDCSSGASGDMILGALVDAGLAIETLQAEVAKLGLPGLSLSASPVTRGGIRGTKIHVEAPKASQHRYLKEILSIIDSSGLSSESKENVTRIFRRLAEAEATVHGISPEEVHFHEVGALDAIADVVGAVAGLEALGIERVWLSPLPLGHGTVESAHGLLPVPAPATAELVKGFPVLGSDLEVELLTPTGAAILTTLASGVGPLPPMHLVAVGSGAGSRELPRPNLLRLFVGEADPPVDVQVVESVVQIEATIDDMNPQLYEPLMAQCFEDGALDVTLTPVIMKKGRPGVIFSVLSPPDRLRDLAALLFRESTTIGLRWQTVERMRLGREMLRLPTIFGPVTFKVARQGGRVVNLTPEFEECRLLARSTGRPLKEVMERVRVDGWEALGEGVRETP